MNETTRRAFIFGAAAVAAGSLFYATTRLGKSAVASDEPDRGPAGPVTIAEFSADGKRQGTKSREKIRKSAAEWQRQLSPDSFHVTRHAATETPYSGELEFEHRVGIYRCICCENALFDSRTKFESGTGWPSFWEPIAKENVYERLDMSYGTARQEVKCTLCDAHLGHVFPDGPDPTGLRYCMNSVAMKFAPRSA